MQGALQQLSCWRERSFSEEMGRFHQQCCNIPFGSPSSQLCMQPQAPRLWLKFPLCNAGFGTLQPSKSDGTNSVIIYLLEISSSKVNSWNDAPSLILVENGRYLPLEKWETQPRLSPHILSDNTWEMVNNKLKTLQPQGKGNVPFPPPPLLFCFFYPMGLISIKE